MKMSDTETKPEVLAENTAPVAENTAPVAEAPAPVPAVTSAADLDKKLSAKSSNDDDDDYDDEDFEEAVEQALEAKGEDVPTYKTDGLPEALGSVKDFLRAQEKLFMVVRALEALLPAKKPKEQRYSVGQLKNHFCCGEPHRDTFNTGLGLNPPSIALITLHEFFSDETRFEKVDPNKLPYADKLLFPYEPPKLTHTTIDIAGKQFTVPVSNETWYTDKKTGHNFTVEYEPSPGGSIATHIRFSPHQRKWGVELGNELKLAVMTSPLLKGQILEINGGNDFKIIDLGPQVLPVIEDDLMDELNKNIVNLFDQREKFDEYKLPIKRSVILEGLPGNGKTMICRYLAQKCRGKVTTVWVTAKSITEASDVAHVFDIARKLSPSLVIMEDLDLISGTREMLSMGGDNALGEMLNQLDGLEANDSIVMVGSTNRASSLDEALRERPGRFDRIYEVGKPSAELAKQICRDYLVKRGMDQTELDLLTFPGVLSGKFTGAQLVELIKGAIFEAIHRKQPLNDLHISASVKGLTDQNNKYATKPPKKKKGNDNDE